MKKGFVVAVFLGVAFAAASSPRHNDPAASTPAHSAQAPASQTASKTGTTSGGSSQSRPQVATNQAITLNTGLPTSAPQAFGWLIVLACTVALIVAIATVVLTAAALRG
jgi:pectate lyase